MLKKKRGSHVGVVLSFVIFMGFLIFLYPLLIQPVINTNENKEHLLERLSSDLIESTSSNLKTLTVKIDTSTGNCVRLRDFMTDFEIDSRLVVRNEFKGYEVSYTPSNNLEIVRGDLNYEFFKIYNSQEFEQVSNEQQSPCQDRLYEIGSVRDEKIVFETKILDLVNNYNNDYDSLKSNLNVSAGNDFDFLFTYEDGTTNGIRKDSQTNIYSEETHVKYSDVNGDILLGKFNVRVW